jgi:hydroxycarboxylate dehydrogenase B
MPTVSAEVLQRTIMDILLGCNVPAEEARIVAEHLVDAEACGLPSHGALRVPQYVQAIADGQIVPGARLHVLSETIATAVLDGGHGFGQMMASKAMDMAIDRAEQAGVGVLTLCNCGHTGRLGSYTEQAARCGMAGMMMVNSGGHGQWVAPFGATAGRLATNPLSIAVPTSSGDPLLLDMATSASPEGKVRALLAAGLPVPEGWVIDHTGNPTSNPADLYGPPRGALLPFGGHKGFGLAMLIEALAGGLSGAGCCHDADAPLAGKTDGVFLMALRIEAFVPLAAFEQVMTQLVRHVKSSPSSVPGGEVLVPGETEARHRRRALREGITIVPATWNGLLELRRKFQPNKE